jgi:hypothetical protein
MTLGGTRARRVTFLILVLLHYTLRPLLGWRAPMDFLLLALLLASIRCVPQSRRSLDSQWVWSPIRLP